MTTKRFRSVALFLTFLFMVGCNKASDGNGSENQAVTKPSLAIQGVTVIDAKHGVREMMTVVLQGDVITQVLEGQDASPDAAQVIDGRGKYLIPGLWDMHVHITYEPALTPIMADLFLDYGITSVRDTGGMLPELLPEIERWRAPQVRAPRIYFSGPLLDGQKVVYDGDDRPEIGIANANVEAAKANVQRLVDAGADFIKIYELVSPEVFDALVGLAQQNQLPIAAHVPLSLLADEAGPRVNSMEHLRNIELACAEDADQLLTERREILAQTADASGYQLRSQLHTQFRARALQGLEVNAPRCVGVAKALVDTIQVPTLRLNTITVYSPLQRADWLEHLAKLPPQVSQLWQQTAASFLGKAPPISVQMATWSLQLVQALHSAGVPIGAGTDTPIGQAIPGYSLHTELERLVEAGLTPLQAIGAATQRPAEFFGLEASHGQIAPGYVGDLVLLSADPTKDITNTRAIEAVVAQGVVVRGSP